MFFLSYFVFLTLEEVNGAIISWNIHAMPSLPIMQHQKLMNLSSCYVDSHIQNGAVTMSLSLKPTMAAYTFITDNSEQITHQLPYL